MYQPENRICHILSGGSIESTKYCQNCAKEQGNFFMQFDGSESLEPTLIINRK